MKIKKKRFIFTIVRLEYSNHDVLLKCCTAAEEYAEKENRCTGFQPPVVPSEMISACLFSSEICCTSRLRIEHCRFGVAAAQNGSDCHNPNNNTGNGFYKNCCEACKVGLILGSMPHDCPEIILYGGPFDDSFKFCCKQTKEAEFTIAEGEGIFLQKLFFSFRFILINMVFLLSLIALRHLYQIRKFMLAIM